MPVLVQGTILVKFLGIPLSPSVSRARSKHFLVSMQRLRKADWQSTMTLLPFQILFEASPKSHEACISATGRGPADVPASEELFVWLQSDAMPLVTSYHADGIDQLEKYSTAHWKD